MSPGRPVLPLLVALALASAADATAATKQECISASERGQRARLDGKLIEAQRELAVCARAECPNVVRHDCGEWLAEVTKLTPTLVVAVKDPQGADVMDARVTLDGVLLAEKPDGKAVPVPAGSHVLRVEHGRLRPSETRVVIREGEKGRVIGVTLEAPEAPVKPSPPRPPREHTTLPWVVAGVGGVAMATGGVLTIVGFGGIPDNCSYGAQQCTPLPNATRAENDKALADAKSATTLAYAGIITMTSGAALLVGGLVWHFVEPTDPRQGLIVVPVARADGGGLSLHARFRP